LVCSEKREPTIVVQEFVNQVDVSEHHSPAAITMKSQLIESFPVKVALINIFY
jgi:hypothetical protein